MNPPKRIVILALFASCLPALLFAGAGGKAEDEQKQGDPWSRWSHTAAIKPQGEIRGLVSFSLSLEVFDLARPDLADLRVVSEAGDETGYTIRVDRGWEKKKPIAVELYNRTYLPTRCIWAMPKPEARTMISSTTLTASGSRG